MMTSSSKPQVFTYYYMIELCLANQLYFIPTIKTVQSTYIYKSMSQVRAHQIYAHLGVHSYIYIHQMHAQLSN